MVPAGTIFFFVSINFPHSVRYNQWVSMTKYVGRKYIVTANQFPRLASYNQHGKRNCYRYHW